MNHASTPSDSRTMLSEAISASARMNAFSHVVGDPQAFFDATHKLLEAKDRLAAALQSEGYAGFSGTSTRGRLISLTPSAHQEGHWQITRFDDAGEPLGDSQYRSQSAGLEDFLREIDLATLASHDLHAEPRVVEAQEARHEWHDRQRAG